jgi:uncharacterized protein (TIGR00661 family)
LNKKSILICPLDWGLGHATRCVPIVKELQRLNFNVIIGADKNPLAFLHQEFPNIQLVTIPGYEVTYCEKGSSFQLFCESVRFYKSIKQERQLINKIIEEHNIDIIISDNRYGLWSAKIKSIIVTHQLFVKAPFGSVLAHKKIEKLLKNFDECWIPDVYGTPNLSGDLAHSKPIKQEHKFIGPLSRFEKPEGKLKIEYDVCAIISGPEPQRSIFEKLVLEQLNQSDLTAIVVRGLPNEKQEVTNKKQEVKIFNHLRTEKLQQFITKSKMVVCRAGYSSIMDLITLNKKAILVPTPGQTEQEYLANYHLDQGNFYTQKQNELDINVALSNAEKYSPKVKHNLTFNLNFLSNFV